MERPELFKKLQSELKTIAEIKKDLSKNKVESQEQHEDYREPLEITKREEIKIGLSWGGPADGFKLTYYKGELQSGVYYWQDWGTYDEIDISIQEAEEIEDFYLYGDPSTFLS